MDLYPQDVEIKEEGSRHVLILFNCKREMAGSVDFSAANAKSSAQLRVKGDRNDIRTFMCVSNPTFDPEEKQTNHTQFYLQCPSVFLVESPYFHEQHEQSPRFAAICSTTRSESHLDLKMNIHSVRELNS